MPLDQYEPLPNSRASNTFGQTVTAENLPLPWSIRQESRAICSSGKVTSVKRYHVRNLMNFTFNFATAGSVIAAILLFSIAFQTSVADTTTDRRSPSTEELERLGPERPEEKPVEKPEEKPVPAKPTEFIPTGFSAVKGAKIVHVAIPGTGISCFDHIEKITEAGPVRFLLIPEIGDQQAFYLMEHKVWYDLYRLFDEENPDPIGSQAWKKTGESYQKVTGLASPAKLPVFDVPHGRAEEFAKWLCGPNGKLPTTHEWDRAAKFERDAKHGTSGPFKQPLGGQSLDIAVGLKAPWEIDRGKHDISRSGCRQMAGNGKEWTSSPVPLAPIYFTLRGRSFNAPKPLLYADFSDDHFGIQNLPSPYVSFRVAIELNTEN
jgi:hypothetical protein